MISAALSTAQHSKRKATDAPHGECQRHLNAGPPGAGGGGGIFHDRLPRQRRQRVGQAGHAADHGGWGLGQLGYGRRHGRIPRAAANGLEVFLDGRCRALGGGQNLVRLAAGAGLPLLVLRGRGPQPGAFAGLGLTQIGQRSGGVGNLALRVGRHMAGSGEGRGAVRRAGLWSVLFAHDFSPAVASGRLWINAPLGAVAGIAVAARRAAAGGPPGVAGAGLEPPGARRLVRRRGMKHTVQAYSSRSPRPPGGDTPGGFFHAANSRRFFSSQSIIRPSS